jgi:uncharacterized membrane protein
MNAFTRAIYAVFGSISILAGLAVLAAPSLLARPSDPPIVSHLLREEAAAFIFIGLVFFWARRHFAIRRPIHLALLVFTALLAGVHWADYFGDHAPIKYSLWNTAPFVVLLVTTPRRPETRVAARASL